MYIAMAKDIGAGWGDPIGTYTEKPTKKQALRNFLTTKRGKKEGIYITKKDVFFVKVPNYS